MVVWFFHPKSAPKLVFGEILCPPPPRLVPAWCPTHYVLAQDETWSWSSLAMARSLRESWSLESPTQANGNAADNMVKGFADAVRNSIMSQKRLRPDIQRLKSLLDSRDDKKILQQLEQFVETDEFEVSQ